MPLAGPTFGAAIWRAAGRQFASEWNKAKPCRSPGGRSRSYQLPLKKLYLKSNRAPLTILPAWARPRREFIRSGENLGGFAGVWADRRRKSSMSVSSTRRSALGLCRGESSHSHPVSGEHSLAECARRVVVRAVSAKQGRWSARAGVKKPTRRQAKKAAAKGRGGATLGHRK